MEFIISKSDILGIEFSNDFKQKLFYTYGNIWVYDIASTQYIPLVQEDTVSVQSITDVKFQDNEEKVYLDGRGITLKNISLRDRLFRHIKNVDLIVGTDYYVRPVAAGLQLVSADGRGDTLFSNTIVIKQNDLNVRCIIENYKFSEEPYMLVELTETSATIQLSSEVQKIPTTSGLEERLTELLGGYSRTMRGVANTLISLNVFDFILNEYCVESYDAFCLWLTKNYTYMLGKPERIFPNVMRNWISQFETASILLFGPTVGKYLTRSVRRGDSIEIGRVILRDGDYIILLRNGEDLQDVIDNEDEFKGGI